MSKDPETACAQRWAALKELLHVLVEQPLMITASDARQIGAFIWHLDHQTPNHGVVLAHGAGDENRQMGVIVPQLAEAGYAVLTFDQRGTLLSAGNWRADGSTSGSST